MKNYVKTSLFALAFLMSMAGIFAFSPPTVDSCNGCEYDMEYKKSINQGDDTVYKLRCKKTGNTYDVYQRKNGKWERNGTSQKYEKCELVRFMCDCDK
jgi:hypothetical protein